MQTNSSSTMADAAPGAELTSEGVRYAIWAPERPKLEVFIYGDRQAMTRKVTLTREEDGMFVGLDPEGQVGDLYKFHVEGAGEFPDPASRYQPQGVHGPSQVISAAEYPWQDEEWQRPPFRDLVIYELHIGTFSAAGTFRSAIERLPHLRELGINALEIMPVADFPGERGWGYDGVQLYAPAHCYGTPDDMRAFVEAAHAQGIAVILDVVYNHFGPDGNYITQYSPYYFSHEDKTPWGDAVNFGHDKSRPVRTFYSANVLFWMSDFHVDGFRLDATHAIIDPSEKHILAELAEMVHERGGYIIAEDERNEARIVASPESGGYGFDGVWADDFHHIVEVGLIEASVYKKDFEGDLSELVQALQQGWFYCGQNTRKRGIPRGTACEVIHPEHFIFCISNHDQVGNRAFGERLNHLVSPAAYRAASALLLLSPYTPLLFQGQEWAASAPFQYFTHHGEELGRMVEQGRREEFKDAFDHHDGSREVPSPQSESTFQDSKLPWEELDQPEHAQTLSLYRDLIALRHQYPAFRPTSREGVRFAKLDWNVLAIRAKNEEAELLIVCDLAGGHEGGLGEEFCLLPEGRKWELVLSTNEERFGGAGAASQGDRLHLAEPEVLVFRAGP